MSAAVELGQELRRLRVSKGLSQRALTKRLGLSAHSNIADYENGRRIPPRDIVQECERVLDSDTLVPMLDRALAERAGHVEAGLAETGLAETGLAETGLAETGFAETGFAETGFAETGFAETGFVKAGPRRRWLMPLALILATVLLAGAAIGWSAGRPPPGPPPGSQPVTTWDGNDPKAAGCATDAISIDSKPVGIVGLVLLRYSPACQAAWAKFHPAAGIQAGRAMVVVEAVRPSDGIKTTFQYPSLTQVYGDVLLTGPGCVRASATVTLPDGTGATGSTACLQGL